MSQVRRSSTVVLAALLVLCASARGLDRPYAAAQKKTLLVINFDVEDYITPASEGIDDIPLWLARIMTEEGVTGTFYVIGEKARSLEKRGRSDVIAAMARHDIGSHTNFGSVHPTVTEILERADWDAGVQAMVEREEAGFLELERIFRVPVRTMGRHGGSYGPQLVASLGLLGKGFSGSPVGFGEKTAAWFCNALNFSFQYGGFFDDVLYRDDLFEPVFEKMKAELPKLAAEREAVSFFIGHPTKIRAEQFWDFNYYGGRNPAPEEWKAPALRPASAMATAQKNFRRILRWLKEREDIEITTFAALMDHYGEQKEIITAAELAEFASVTVASKAIVPSADFSPAEVFAGLAESLVEFDRLGRRPSELKAVRPLGPSEMPREKPGVAPLGRKDVFDLARQALAHIRKTGALPANLGAGGSLVGTGSLYALFSAAYLDLEAIHPRDAFDLVPFDPYPRPNEKKAVDLILGYKSWPVHRPDSDMTKIVELTRLQLWTLKPARLR